MIRFFCRHPTAANLLMLFLIAVGIISIPNLKRETFPDFAPLQVQVQVAYPGASSSDVELAICRNLEDAIESIDFLSEYRCIAQQGIGILTAKMQEKGNLNKFINDIKNKVDGIDNLPADAEEPIIRQVNVFDQVVTLAITAPLNAPMLQTFAEEIKDKIQALPNVSQVDIAGFSDRQFKIKVDTAALYNYGLSIDHLANLITKQNVDSPAGEIKALGADFLIRLTDERRTIDDLKALTIIANAESGMELRLGDIATIKDGFEDERKKYLLNGERAAFLRISKSKQQDTLTVMDSLRRFVIQEKQKHPSSVKFYFTEDFSSIVEDRLSMLTRNALQGFVLVMIIMTLFFKWRYAFWIGAGLPIAFLGTFFVLVYSGQSINMISMVALLIAIGLLMDDAIVIAENIATYHEKGASPFDAAILGTKEVLPGVFSSFLTTCAIFIPLAFIAGNIGKVLSVIPIVLIFVLSISLIEAFLILPHHLAHSLHKQQLDKYNKLSDKINEKLESFKVSHLKIAVEKIIRYRYLFLGSIVALFIFSLFLIINGNVKFLAFPEIEGDVIQARVQLPQGTPFHKTEKIANLIANALLEVDSNLEKKYQQKIIQQITIQYGENLDVDSKGNHLVTVSADLLKSEIRKANLSEIFMTWRKRVGVIPDAIAVNFKEPQIGPGGRAIDIQVLGDDLDRIKQVAMQLQSWFSRYPGVFDLHDNLIPGKPEIRMSLKPGALALGWNVRTIAQQLRAAYYGKEIIETQTNTENIEVTIQLTEADQTTIYDFEKMVVIGPNLEQVPLAEIVNFDYNQGFATIDRWDGQRAVLVRGDINNQVANAREILQDTQLNFLPGMQQQFPDVTISFKGQNQEANTSMDSMLAGFQIGLLFIYIILSFLFRSYVAPVVVITVIPLAMIGVISGHLLLGLAISMPSIMGFISLSGVVVNDSILVVRKLQTHLNNDIPLAQAVTQASLDRFRAVILTSLTTIAGLLPLLFERSLQAQVLIPLVTSIAFGLLASTALVLFVVPCFYYCLADFNLLSKKGLEVAEI